MGWDQTTNRGPANAYALNNVFESEEMILFDST
jgi:hypothetical protein